MSKSTPLGLACTQAYDDYTPSNLTRRTRQTARRTRWARMAMIALLLLSGAAMHLSANTTIDNIEYSFTDTTAIVEGYNETSVEKITIPGSVTYEGKTYPVTEIGYDAFNYKRYLTEVTLPEGLEIISNSAFSYCKKLERINLPNTIHTIDSYAFSGCHRLTDITLPVGLTEIASSLFSDCKSLKTISIPKGVTIIGQYAFDDCTNLESISIPDGVTDIGQRAFNHCTKLEEFTLPSALKTLSDNAFNSCVLFENMPLPKGIEYIGAEIFKNCINLKTTTLPEGITDIGYGIYLGCTSLNNITIPKGINRLGSGLFYNCTSLTNVTLPDDLKEVGSGMFQGCTALETITIPEGVTIIDWEVFKECTNLKEVKIPSSLVVIESNAFQSCSSLLKLTLPESLTTIESYAFSGCSSLESINLPDAVINLKGGAFHYCTSLKQITLPKDLLEIETYMFQGCTSLEQVTFNDKLELINSWAFNGCTSLKQIDLTGNIKTILYEAFKSCKSLKEVILPENLEEVSSNVFMDCSGIKKVVFSDHFEKISDGLFASCTNLTELTLPDSLREIGSGAFSNCDILEHVEFPAKLERAYNAFTNCDRLSAVTFTSPTPQRNINGDQFETTNIFYVPVGSRETYLNSGFWTNKVIIEVGKPTCITVHLAQPGTLLEEILKQVASINDVNELTISGYMNEEDCIQIRDKAKSLLALDMRKAIMKKFPVWCTFRSMKNLLRVVLPETLETINHAAFQYCSFLTEVEMPATLKVIESSAFYDCTSLKSITLPESLEVIESHTFFNCSSLESIKIPSLIREIEYNTFDRCEKLKKVELHSGITAIGSDAFSGCFALSEFDFLEGLKTIGRDAFSGCAFTTLTLPSSLTSLGEGAFSGCTRLTFASIPYAINYCSNTFHACENLTRLECHTTTPPRMDDNDQFISYHYDDDRYNRVELYVPALSIESYRIAPIWEKFSNIKPLPTSPKQVDIWGKYLLREEGRFDNDPNVSVYLDGEFIIRGDKPLKLESYTQSQRIYTDNYPLLCRYTSLLSEASSIEAERIETKLTLPSTRWVFFSPQYDVKLSSITTTDDAVIVVRRYDGNGRATGVKHNWIAIGADEILQAGIGYIVQANKQTTISLVAVDNEQKYRIFSSTNIVQPLQEYPSEKPLDISWNFIGNPYPCFFDARLINHNGPITTWDMTNKTYRAYTARDDQYILAPMEGFFVQKEEKIAMIEFDTDGRQTTNEANPELELRSASAEDRLVLNFMLSDGTYNDQTRIAINNEASIGYETACDAAKFMSSDDGVPQLFSLDPSKQRYAINERNRDNGRIALGIYAPQDGRYTLTLVDLNDEIDETILLIDHELGTETSLNDGQAYDCLLKGGETTDRFEIRLGMPTEIAGGEASQSRAYAVDGNLVIEAEEGSQVSIFTAAGQLVDQFVASAELSSVALTPGLYLVQIDNETFKISINN